MTTLIEERREYEVPGEPSHLFDAKCTALIVDSDGNRLRPVKSGVNNIVCLENGCFIVGVKYWINPHVVPPDRSLFAIREVINVQSEITWDDLFIRDQSKNLSSLVYSNGWFTRPRPSNWGGALGNIVLQGMVNKIPNPKFKTAIKTIQERNW